MQKRSIVREGHSAVDVHNGTLSNNTVFVSHSSEAISLQREKHDLLQVTENVELSKLPKRLATSRIQSQASVILPGAEGDGIKVVLTEEDRLWSVMRTQGNERLPIIIERDKRTLKPPSVMKKSSINPLRIISSEKEEKKEEQSLSSWAIQDRYLDICSRGAPEYYAPYIQFERKAHWHLIQTLLRVQSDREILYNATGGLAAQLLGHPALLPGDFATADNIRRYFQAIKGAISS